MRRLRVSVPILILFFFIIGTGSISYISWINHKQLIQEIDKTHKQRILDKISSQIQSIKDYDKFFEIIANQDDIIKKVSAFKLDNTPLTKGSEIPSNHRDIFIRTVRSKAFNRIFNTPDNKFLYFIVNPDLYYNLGNEFVVQVELIDAVEESFISKYFPLLLNIGISIIMAILLIMFVLVYINIGLSPLKKFASRIPLSIHKGEIFTEIGMDNEIEDAIDKFKWTAMELNKINNILSILSLSKDTDTFITTLFDKLKDEGMKSFVIMIINDYELSTYCFKGEWENQSKIENFILKIDDIESGESLAFPKLIKEKDYIVLNKSNQNNYSNIDIDILGIPSIYIPLLLNGEVVGIMGGSGEISSSVKNVLVAIGNRWSDVFYGIIENIKNNENNKIEIEKYSNEIEKYSNEIEKYSNEIEKLKKENEKLKKLEKEAKEKPLFKQSKKIINQINEKTNEYNKMYKEGLIFAKNKEYDKALEKLLNIPENKRNYNTMKLIGTCYYNNKEYEKSIEFWNKYLKDKPEDNEVIKFKEKAELKLKKN